MRNRLIAIGALVVITMLAQVGLADDINVVQNGTFQLSTSFNGAPYVTLHAGSGLLPGWTIGGESVDVINTYWQAPPGGGNSVDLSGNGAGLTSQSLNTVPVGSYWNISFYLAANPDGKVPVSVEVDFGSNSWIFTATPTGSTANMNWQLITINNIYIDGSPTTLSFTSLTNAVWGPVIGGVSVVDPVPEVPPSVPEPASMVLLGSGLLGLAGLARRKKKS